MQRAALSHPGRAWLISGLVLIIWTMAVTSFAYRLGPGWNVVGGDYYDRPYLSSGFSLPELMEGTERHFRWTTGDALISQPLVGCGAWVASLTLFNFHPDGSPANARLRFSDGTTLQLPDTTEPRSFRFFVPPQASGNLDLRLQSAVYRETTKSARELGTTLFGFQATPLREQPLLAPWMALAFLGIVALAAAWTLAVAGLERRLAHGLAAALVTGLALGVAVQRLPYAFWLSSLALLSLVGLALTALLRWSVPRLMRLGGVEIDERALRPLLLLFVGGFWIKAGGQLYPYMISIDVHWHMEHVRLILKGQLEKMYLPGAFNESVMPEKEWGANRPTIPYSPFFHIFATVFAIFPWRLETTAKVFSAAIDVSRVFLIFYFARAFGLTRRAGLLGAALYSVFPATYLLHSWGNVPTTFGMWWTLVVSAVIVGTWGRLEQRRFWLLPAAVALGIGASLLGMWGAIIGGVLILIVWFALERGRTWMLLLLLLLATFLIYTVMAVYLGMLLILWLAWIAWRRREERGQVRAVAWAIVGALGMALAIYYAQYVPDIIRKTLPYFGQTLTQGQESVGAVPFQETYSDYLWQYVPRLRGYGLLVPLLLQPLAFWLLRRGAQVDRSAPRAWMGPVWMAMMLLVGLIFVPIARAVPMVDKNVFFVMPVLALGTGLVLDSGLAWAASRLRFREGAVPRWQRLLLAAPVAAYIALLFGQSILLWVDRIVRIKQD